MREFDDDIEAMLGGRVPYADEELLERPSSRSSDRSELRLQQAVEKHRMASGAAADNVLDGVSVPWLARVFDLDPVTVRKRLVGCPKLRVQTSGHLYDLAQAARYLVTPKLDQKAFIQAIKNNELPPAMQEAYWSAVVKRNKAEQEAGDLWESDKVYDTLTNVFKIVRDTLKLFPDALEKEVAVTAEQRRILVKMTNGLQATIQKSLLDLAQTNETPPVRARVVAEADGSE